MLSALQSFVIVLLAVGASLLTLLAIRRIWPVGHRHKHNDLIGSQIGFLGTTYAVILAFMLSDVWNSYQTAASNAEIEANALVNIHRVAPGLPQPQAAQVKDLAHTYADVMLRDEWPAMFNGHVSRRSHEVITSLWQTVIDTHPQSPSEQVAYERALADLTNMTERRRIRELESRSSLPRVFWMVLITGAVLTILYTCLFDVEDLRIHALQVIGVSFLIALILVVINDVDSPFGGALRLQPSSFELALRSMDNLPSNWE